jgi:hypothetical protein
MALAFVEPVARKRHGNQEDYAMQVSYTKCRSCGESVRTSAKFCFNCGKSARPLPVFWFTFLSALFVTYVLLDTYSLV